MTPRFGVFEAGLASARDPKYTVVPQRGAASSTRNGASRGRAGMSARPRAAATSRRGGR